MENILYEEQNNSNLNINTTPQRPTFLTVLCILTFIGSALAFINAIYTYFTVRSSAAMFDTAGDGSDPTGMVGALQQTLQKAAENAVPNLIIGIVCSLLCLFGALQMWKLLKRGFYIYCVGEIVPPIAQLFLGAGGMFGSMTTVIGFLIAIIWIVLYGVNLKHMK